MLQKSAHAVYTLQFHYVACAEHRRKVFIGDIGERLKSINLSIAESFGITIVEQETAADYIHILFSSKPQVQLSRFVNILKSVSARLLLREFPELRKQFWDGHLWCSSYFLVSTGQMTPEDLREYLESQGLRPIGQKLSLQCKLGKSESDLTDPDSCKRLKPRIN